MRHGRRHGNIKAEVMYLACLGFAPQEIIDITDLNPLTVRGYYNKSIVNYSKAKREEVYITPVEMKIRAYYSKGMNIDFIWDVVRMECSKPKFNRIMMEIINNTISPIRDTSVMRKDESKAPYWRDEAEVLRSFNPTYSVDEFVAEEKVILNKLRDRDEITRAS